MQKKCKEENKRQQAKEKEFASTPYFLFVDKLIQKEEKLKELRDEKHQKVMLIMEENNKKAKVKEIIDLQERKEDSKIGQKLDNFEKEIRDRLKYAKLVTCRMKQKELDKSVQKNACHLDDVKTRLKKLRKHQDKEQMKTACKVIMEHKKREAILKDLNRTRNHRSASAYRNE